MEKVVKTREEIGSKPVNSNCMDVTADVPVVESGIMYTVFLGRHEVCKGADCKKILPRGDQVWYYSGKHYCSSKCLVGTDGQ